MMRFSIVLLCTLPFASVAWGHELGSFQDQVRAFTARYCVDCHGPDEQKAGLRLDALQADLADEQSLARWVRVHDKLAAGEMPPADSQQPPKGDKEDLLKRLRA